MQMPASTNLKNRTEKVCSLPTAFKVSWVLNGRAEIQNQRHLMQKTILLTFIQSFTKLSLIPHTCQAAEDKTDRISAFTVTIS